MKKERLEEVIKQRVRKKLWSINFFIYNLENCHIEDGVLMDDTEHAWCEIKNLYETKEQVKWALKTVAERTERFEPPMWKDLVTPYHFTFIVRSEKDSSDLGTYALYVYQSGIMIEEDIESHHKQHHLFDKDFTKENYEKACEIVRDLFKGEK